MTLTFQVFEPQFLIESPSSSSLSSSDAVVTPAPSVGRPQRLSGRRPHHRGRPPQPRGHHMRPLGPGPTHSTDPPLGQTASMHIVVSSDNSRHSQRKLSPADHVTHTHTFTHVDSPSRTKTCPRTLPLPSAAAATLGLASSLVGRWEEEAFLGTGDDGGLLGL